MSATRLLVERFYEEIWNRGDEDVAREILDAGFRFRGSLGSLSNGRDGFIAYVRQVRAALGDYECLIEDLVDTGDRAAARLTFRGIHRGRLFGVPATGKMVAWQGAAFFTIANGRIVELWVLGDIDALKRQLGAAADAGFAD
jgi:steroid delta-isomerase-like uncharacterized protein